MMLAIEGVLTSAETAAVVEAASALEFGDGRATAGRFAREVKVNDQALPGPGLDAILKKAERALAANELFQAAARPRAVTRLILSRYRVGQTYGTHVDDALMQGLRTDVSFSLFLSDPADYAGGALEIEDSFEARQVRLPAGGLFLYPATTLHRVTPVTRGERLAIVGWAQSWIRSAERREVLFDLERALRDTHAREGKSPVFDTLSKTRSNLLRMWAGD